MKLTICFLLFCVLYAGATTKSCDTVDTTQLTPSTDGILTQGLEMVLEILQRMDRKLLELHFKLNEHREEVDRIRVTQEKSFIDFLWAMQRLDDSVTKDVGRNISLLQDQSLLILTQQSACASHEKFREKWFPNSTSQDIEGGQEGLVKPHEGSRFSFSALYKSQMANCVTSTTAPPSQESPTPAATSTTPKPQIPSYSSCRHVPSKVSGVYLIRVNNDSLPFPVYCEQEKFEGGWIVVQHRFDGSVDFYRNWTEYCNGFGNLDSEFWLGLERIHQLTTVRTHEIIIEMKDFENNYKYARYGAFEVGGESEQYSLKALRSYSGTAGDSMTEYNKGQKFSTKDQDNDGNSGAHYAVRYEGAWWHAYNAGFSSLNGPYQNTTDGKSIWWYYFKTSHGYHAMSFSRMMIRELSNRF